MLNTISNETERVINKLPTKKSPRLDGFPSDFYIIFKDIISPILLKPIKDIERDNLLPNLFMEASITFDPQTRQ